MLHAGRWGKGMHGHLMPEEITRLSVASTVSCTAAVQFMAPLLVTYMAPCSMQDRRYFARQAA